MAKIESQIIPVQDTKKPLRVTPDQILSREEYEYLKNMDRVLGGCEGQEYWGDELRKPNWPPRTFEGLIQLVNDVEFRIKHPHAWEAFNKLIKENLARKNSVNAASAAPELGEGH